MQGSVASIITATSPVPLPDIGHESILDGTRTGWGWPGHGTPKLLRVKERLMLKPLLAREAGEGNLFWF